MTSVTQDSNFKINLDIPSAFGEVVHYFGEQLCLL